MRAVQVRHALYLALFSGCAYASPMQTGGASDGSFESTVDTSVIIGLTIDALSSEIKDEVPTATVSLVPRTILKVHPRLGDLDRNLGADSGDGVRLRSKIAQQLGIRLAESIEWNGCEGSLGPRPVRKSLCPETVMAILAVGDPEPTARSLGLSTARIRVRTITTILEPMGANTRFMDLVLESRRGQWVIVDRINFTYRE